MYPTRQTAAKWTADSYTSQLEPPSKVIFPMWFSLGTPIVNGCRNRGVANQRQIKDKSNWGDIRNTRYIETHEMEPNESDMIILYHF